MKYFFSAVVLSLSVVGNTHAADAPKWANSYSVGENGDQCYCVMNKHAGKNRGDKRKAFKKDGDESQQIAVNGKSGESDKRVGRDKRRGVVTVDVGGRDTDISTVCQLINSVLGAGGSGEKKYYQSLQCGHPPVLNSRDASCMGVPAGVSKDCDATGPYFNLGRIFDKQN